MPMKSRTNQFFQLTAVVALTAGLTAVAQSPAPTPAPAAPAAAPTWSLGPMAVSGVLDGYYSYNANRPSDYGNGQVNDYYNFNDKTNQFNLSAAKLSLSHDADPVGARIDLLFGRTNEIINAPWTASNSSDADQLKYIEQAFITFKPAKAKGLTLDFGKFVTSAGAEVIESKDNWNYSRSLLFVNMLPYWHFGLRSAIPTSAANTVGLQVVNGWNNVNKSNGGVTIGLTEAYVKPKYSYNLNYYVGPEHADTQQGYRNLIDTTLLLTPTAKLSAYINYDYLQERNAAYTNGKWVTTDLDTHMQGLAVAAKYQLDGKQAFAGRYEYGVDNVSSDSSVHATLQEFTATYEYKWLEGLLTRLEYRHDWSDQKAFTYGDNAYNTKHQDTLTAAFVAFFGPKR